MKIGFGAPVAGAWATPGYLAAFSEQAEALAEGGADALLIETISDPAEKTPSRLLTMSEGAVYFCSTDSMVCTVPTMR